MKVWEEFLRQEEKELGPDIVSKWLRPLQVADYDACNLYLQAKDTFQILWFDEHIRKKAEKSLLNNNRKKIKIHISTEAPQKNKKKQKKIKEKAVSPEQPPFNIEFDALDPHCTFDSFSPGTTNAMPYKLLCKATNELGNYNPIYICGSSGVGKTHLLMATADALHKQGKAVIYVRAETFTEHVVTAIRAGEMNLFRQSYRNTDVLIIDDVHVLARKAATQEELFHTFNALHVSGKQILLSANCTPGELQFIEPRLISRFEWGIVAPLYPPSREEMQEVLLAKAAALNFVLPPKIVEFLLETFTSSSKAITRAFEALVLRIHLNESKRTSSTLTVPLARQYLVDLIEEEERVALSPEKIMQHVTEFYGMRMEDILGKAQSRDCVLPRQIAMYFCRSQLQMPFMHIGELFSKDHSTVMSSVKLIQKAIDSNDANIAPSYNAILKKLRS